MKNKTGKVFAPLELNSGEGDRWQSTAKTTKKRMPTVISAMQKTKHYDMTDNEGAGRDNIR